MSKPHYRTLQVALRIFSLLLAIGALFMIFSSRALVVRVFLHPPEAEVSTLLLFFLKEMAGMVLMVSAMLFLAWDYGGHEATGYDSRGEMAPGGAGPREQFENVTISRDET